MARKAEQAEPQFVLKHRITGAGIMLAFGVIVLPWLLGPPDDPDRVQAKENSVVVLDPKTELENISEVTPSIDFNDAALTDESLQQLLIESIEQESIEQEEQVYISKITPLDSGGVQAVNDSENTNTTDLKDKQTLASKNQQKLDQEQKQIEEKATTSIKSEPAPKSKPDAEPKSKPEPVVKNDVVDKKEQTVAPEIKDKVIEIGWVVSVGVFSEQKNVEALLESLQNKDFIPHTSIFETNKGAATRVWLGPYELRVDAAKAKTELKEKMGTLGLIKAYP